jgi:hypothetical protein
MMNSSSKEGGVLASLAAAAEAVTADSVVGVVASAGAQGAKSQTLTHQQHCLIN